MTEDKAKQILGSNQIDGLSNAGNNKAWPDRAKSNSYGHNKAQAKDILDGVGAAKDAKGDWSNDWQVRQKDHEGQGWADIDPAAKPNTYTGKGGSKGD